MTTIFVTFRVPGFHRWAEAPKGEYEYLRYSHRHEFHVRVDVLVHGDNREIEFVRFKGVAFDAFYDIAKSSCFSGMDFGTMSCEQLADALREKLKLYAVTRIEVSEDGENGAVKTYGVQ